MPTRRTSDPEPTPAASDLAAEGASGIRIERYRRTRHFAVYEGTELLAVTVYRKGARSLRERLEADARTIDDLQRQIEEFQALTPCFQEQATPANGPPWQPPEQLPLLATEEIPASRHPPRPRPAPRRA